MTSTLQTKHCRADAADAIVAQVLGIGIEGLDDELSYQSISEWDSLRHVAIMLALEQSFGVKIDCNLTLELDSLGAIRKFVAGCSAPAPSASPAASASTASAAANSERAATAHAEKEAAAPQPNVHRGLAGVHVDRSRITRIDGERGILEYRGYSIHDLADYATFEEAAYLLIHGELPAEAELADFKRALAKERHVPVPVQALVRSLADADAMIALRTGVSALAAFDPDTGDDSPAAWLRSGIRLMAQIPMLIAIHHAAKQRRELVTPPPGLSHAGHFLCLLRGDVPDAAEARMIDRDLIVHADHGSNASAFTARVVVGARSDLHAAITAAISAFAGQLHGGAAKGVLALIDAVGSPDRAQSYVSERWARNEPVMGFGHRVYRTEDPRVRHLRDVALEASRKRGDMNGYEVINSVADAMTPYARHGIGANVDLYSGLAYRMLGLPDDLAVPIFVAGRIAGWVAQSLEQLNNNVLIRPLLHYVGETGKTHPRASGHHNSERGIHAAQSA